MTSNNLKFEIGKEYETRNGKACIKSTFVAIARNNKKVVFIQVSIYGAFQFHYEREIITDSDNGEFVHVDEYNGDIYATDTCTAFCLISHGYTRTR